MNRPRLAQPSRLLDAWSRFWFSDIPPHVYALLRIAFGLIGIVNLVALHNLDQFWDGNGFVPVPAPSSVQAWLVAHAAAGVVGRALYFAGLATFLSMTLGYASGTSVALALVFSLVQLWWNLLPLSGANHAFQAVLFCLVWADTGAVWSLDAWRGAQRGDSRHPIDPTRCLIAPLRLIRFQIAVIYLNSGLWKLMNPLWRDGSAVHYVLSNNVYRRFPLEIPASADWLTTAATYATLLWELSFAFLIPFKHTRRVLLWAGVSMHLGMMALLEIGPFHMIMLAAYIAYLDPHQATEWPDRLRAFVSSGKPLQSGVDPHLSSTISDRR